MQNVIIPLLFAFLAGLSTVLGSLIFLIIKDFKRNYLSFFLGLSAGAMIYVSFIELLPIAINTVGFISTNIAFFIGIIFIGLVDYIVPHHYLKMCPRKGRMYNELRTSSYMIVFAIALHNFPEGAAVFMTSLGDLRYGFFIAIAIALHNIPEGIAISVPVYFATKSRLKAFNYSFIAGMSEPVGAIIAFLVLRPFLTQNLLAYIYACVAGIMVYISFDELLPSCFKNSEGHTAILGIVSGMIMMSFSLMFL